MTPWWWSWLLAAFGLAGLWLAGNKKRGGWAVCAASQLLWLVYALATEQYGFIATALCYGFLYVRNWMAWKP